MKTCLRPVAAALLMLVLPLAGAEKTLRILATADLHGNVAAMDTVLAEAVRNEFAAAPGRVLYVDAGDTAQGTPEVWKTRGAGVLRKLYAAGCTVWVPGNHEIEYGRRAFAAMVREFPGLVLAANLHAPELAGKVRPWSMVTLDGVKIAVIGLMLPRMNQCFPIPGNEFETVGSEEVLRRCVGEALDAGADLVMVVRHGGVYSAGENLYSLMKTVPGVDLIVGAHTHKADPGRRIGGAWYVQPPPHAEGLVRVTAVLDAESRRLLRFESELLELPAAAPRPEAWQLREVTMSAPPEQWAAEAMRRKSGADVAVYALRSRKDAERLAALHPLTVRDCFAAFPHCDRIVAVELTADEIRTVLAEYGALMQKRKGVLTASGLTFRMKRNRLVELTFAADKPCYRVALSSYAAAGAGGFLPRTRALLKGKLDYRQAEEAAPLLEALCGESW